MSIAESVSAAILGFLQGMTEFLPVSSSGHLVLFQQFLHVPGDEILFDLIVHLGTLIPVLWFYRSDVGRVLVDPFSGSGPWRDRAGVRLLVLLLVASVPTALIGLAFEDVFASLVSTPAPLVITFSLTGSLLLATRWAPAGERTLDSLPLAFAAILGLVQGLAITPGISRSGSTIAVALFLGVRRDDAARLSFLMSVPAILGAVLLKARRVDPAGVHPLTLGVGFVVALVCGYGALILLVRLVKRGGFAWFAPYCFAAALAAGVTALWQQGVFGG